MPEFDIRQPIGTPPAMPDLPTGTVASAGTRGWSTNQPLAMANFPTRTVASVVMPQRSSGLVDQLIDPSLPEWGWRRPSCWGSWSLAMTDAEHRTVASAVIRKRSPKLADQSTPCYDQRRDATRLLIRRVLGDHD